jgi:hypothetical protein
MTTHALASAYWSASSISFLGCRGRSGMLPFYNTVLVDVNAAHWSGKCFSPTRQEGSQRNDYGRSGEASSNGTSGPSR